MRHTAALALAALISPASAFACLEAEFALDFDGDGMNEKVHIDSCYDLWPEVDNGRLSVSYINDDGTACELHIYGEESEELGYWYTVYGRNRLALTLGRMDTCAITYYWDGEWDAMPFGVVSLCD